MPPAPLAAMMASSRSAASQVATARAGPPAAIFRDVAEHLERGGAMAGETVQCR